MLGALAKRFFGSANDRYIKGLSRICDQVNALEPQLEGLSDDELKARTGELKARIEAGESLDDLLVDAFATVREAAKRTLGQRHFDVQLMGGAVLHRGMISEMKTGEGKTLVATLAAYAERPDRQGRARGHRQRLPGPARRGVDGPDLPLPRPLGRLHRTTRLDDDYKTAETLVPIERKDYDATSPTPPTTSSASTTCATT